MTPTEIKTLRAKLGISQTELGRRIGLKLRQVQNLEAGSSKPSGSVLMLLEQLVEKTMNDYQYAKNKNIEIRVDFARPSSSVDYKFPGEEWTASPFQSAEVNHLNAKQVLRTVARYLENQY